MKKERKRGFCWSIVPAAGAVHGRVLMNAVVITAAAAAAAPSTGLGISIQTVSWRPFLIDHPGAHHNLGGMYRNLHLLGIVPCLPNDTVLADDIWR